jgi:hypothetical protein
LDVVAAFVELVSANVGDELPAFRLSQYRLDFVAKLSDGSPVVLLHDTSSAAHVPSIESEYVDIQFHCTCRVSSSEGPVEAQFAMVRCSAIVPELHELFIRAIASAAAVLPPLCDTAKLQGILRALLDLFRSLSSPADRDIIGLWGELFIIAGSSNVVQTLRAWRAGPFERFDFSSERGCLEVKATTRAERIHTFSLEQLSHRSGSSGFVASLLLQSAAGGTGVIDLARTIDAQAKGQPLLTRKLWTNVARALGSDFSGRLDRHFSYTYAEANFIVYASSDIPAPNVPDDPRITDISFSVNLTSVRSSLNCTLGEDLDSLVL